MCTFPNYVLYSHNDSVLKADKHCHVVIGLHATNVFFHFTSVQYYKYLSFLLAMSPFRASQLDTFLDVHQVQFLLRNKQSKIPPSALFLSTITALKIGLLLPNPPYFSEIL